MVGERIRQFLERLLLQRTLKRMHRRNKVNPNEAREIGQWAKEQLRHRRVVERKTNG